jgi:hypothetical protein
MYSTRHSCQTNEICIFVDTFLKNTQISHFMKIRSVGAELFHTDEQTDMTKLTVAFRNFATRLKTEEILVAEILLSCQGLFLVQFNFDND